MNFKTLRNTWKQLALAGSTVLIVVGASTGVALAAGHVCGGGTYVDQGKVVSRPTYAPSIDLGCKGQGNPIMDMLFAIIRFLSDGVGIVVVLSLIIAGIQYSASGGDPNAAQNAIKRIRSSVIALLVFIFSYAILNYVLPGAVLK